MIKKRFISMLALLCLTVSGAWATEKSINDIAVDDIIKLGDVITNADYIEISYDGHIIALGDWRDATGTITVTRGSIVNDNCVENAAGEYFMFNDSKQGLQGWYSMGKTLYGIPYNESGLKVTGKTWDSEWEFYTLTVELAPAPAEPAGYAVSLKAETADEGNWTAKAGEGDYQSLPWTGWSFVALPTKPNSSCSSRNIPTAWWCSTTPSSTSTMPTSWRCCASVFPK